MRRNGIIGWLGPTPKSQSFPLFWSQQSPHPFHPSLRLHRLKWSLCDLHSVSINISYRITLELVIQGHEIIPVDVGSHDEVYG